MCVSVKLWTYNIKGSCLNLFQGTEWTVCCVAEKRRSDTSSALGRIPRAGRCNSRLKCSIEWKKCLESLIKSYQWCRRCCKYYPPWQNELVQARNGPPCTIPLHIEGAEIKTIGRWNALWSPGWNPNPGHAEIKAVIYFYIRHPPSGIWLRQLYSWLLSPVVKHRILELAIRAVLLLVLHSHKISGQLYVLVTVRQGKGPLVPPGQEAF
jgi:hypothetical protein